MNVINHLILVMPTLELVFYVESSLLQNFGFTLEVCNGKLPVLVFSLSRILELYVYSDFHKYCVTSQYYILNTFVVLLI